MRTILIIAGKDLLLRWRDRLGFFWWMIGFPLLIAVLIGTIFAEVLEGPSQAMPIAIVDEGGAPGADEFVKVLERSQGLAVKRMPRADAQDAVRRGKLTAFVVLEDGFRISPAVFWGRPLPVAVGIDPARRAELSYLQATLYAAAGDLLREQYTDPQRRGGLIDNWLADFAQDDALGSLRRKGLETALAAMDRYLVPASAPAADSGSPPQLAAVRTIPVDASRARPTSSFEVCFPLGMVWGLLGLAAEFAIGLVKEREAGTLLRLRVAPITRLQLLAGNGLACLAASAGVMLFLLAVGGLLFGIQIQSAVALALAVLATALCFVGITMFLSVLGKTEASIGGAAWACLLVMAMLGGGMVPQMFLPAWMEAATYLSPVKWAILGLEGAIWRGFSLAEMARPCAVLVGQGLLFGLLGVTVSSRGAAASG